MKKRGSGYVRAQIAAWRDAKIAAGHTPPKSTYVYVRKSKRARTPEERAAKLAKLEAERAAAKAALPPKLPKTRRRIRRVDARRELDRIAKENGWY